MLRLNMYPADFKAQSRLNSVGLMPYFAADDDTKETIKKAKTEDVITLEGTDTDQDRAQLGQAIAGTIATDSPTEKIRREIRYAVNYQDVQTQA